MLGKECSACGMVSKIGWPSSLRLWFSNAPFLGGLLNLSTL